MTLTLTDMRTWVRQAANLTTSDDTQIDVLINEACRDFRRDAQTKVEPFTDVALTAGDDTYDLTTLNAAGVLRILGIKGASTSGDRPWPVDVMDFQEFMDFQRFDDTSGTPSKITILGLDQFQVWPVPSAGCTVSGWVVPRPATLSTGSSSPAEPAEYHRTIVYRAIQLALEWDRQPWDEVLAFEQRYLQGVGAALAARKRMAGPPKQLRPHASHAGGQRPWSFRREVGLD